MIKLTYGKECSSMASQKIHRFIIFLFNFIILTLNFSNYKFLFIKIYYPNNTYKVLLILIGHYSQMYKTNKKYLVSTHKSYLYSFS